MDVVGHIAWLEALGVRRDVLESIFDFETGQFHDATPDFVDFIGHLGVDRYLTEVWLPDEVNRCAVSDVFTPAGAASFQRLHADLSGLARYPDGVLNMWLRNAPAQSPFPLEVPIAMNFVLAGAVGAASSLRAHIVALCPAGATVWYHATSRDNALGILGSDRLSLTGTAFASEFGYGTYLYDNLDEALWWAMRIYASQPALLLFVNGPEAADAAGHARKVFHTLDADYEAAVVAYRVDTEGLRDEMDVTEYDARRRQLAQYDSILAPQPTWNYTTSSMGAPRGVNEYVIKTMREGVVWRACLHRVVCLDAVREEQATEFEGFRQDPLP